LRIRGAHNATNALAALALACKAGCSLAPMLYGLREYQGEPHRMAPIGIHDGVTYIDDSKGTNVGATVAALNSLGQDNAGKKIVLILGGDGKGQDFTPLALPVGQYVKAVVLIGRDAAQIESALQTTAVTVEHASTLEAAVAIAHRLATAGGDSSSMVLLSPACASLDMFKDYKHRAEVFASALQTLMDDGGFAA
jgi:UDP-N-acetylmuramoylalanine--D-glutamate ligase